MISPAQATYLTPTALNFIYVYVKQYLQQYKKAAILIPAKSSSAARA